ncbi:MAG: KEOPS complex subunit Cgi121 [Methanosarcinaceae archaeon]
MEQQILEGIVVIDELHMFIDRLRNISLAHDVTLQAMNADLIAGSGHLDLAIRNATRAMEEHRNVAKDLGVEIMRYASGKRQIGAAFSIGLTEGENRAVFVIIGDAVGAAANDVRELIAEQPLLKYSPSKKNRIISQFDITDAELEAVGEETIPSLVVERVALVDVLK